MEPTFIPPVANRRAVRAFPFKILWVVIIVAVLGMIAAGMMLLSRVPSPTDEITRLESKLLTLIDITAEGRKNSKNPDVSKATADINLIVRSDLDLITTATGGKNPKPNTTIIATEKTDSKEALEKLKSAAINGHFDQTYVPILIEKLEAAKLQLETVNSKSARPELKSATLAVYNHLTGFIASLKDISL